VRKSDFLVSISLLLVRKSDFLVSISLLLVSKSDFLVSISLLLVRKSDLLVSISLLLVSKSDFLVSISLLLVRKSDLLVSISLLLVRKSDFLASISLLLVSKSDFLVADELAAFEIHNPPVLRIASRLDKLCSLIDRAVLIMVSTGASAVRCGKVRSSRGGPIPDQERQNPNQEMAFPGFTGDVGYARLPCSR